MTDELYGGIEAGGTKFVAVVGSGPDDIIDRLRVDTTDPATTIGACLDFFDRHAGIRSIGIASFGPLELRKSHPEYGRITKTPKPLWSGADLVGPFSKRFGVPVAIETDVNGAALAEVRWGAARGLGNAVYLTVGTGVGGGAVVDGRPVSGLVHPEMGHVSVVRRPGDDFAGICPFHGDCLEGLASGPAIAARWGKPAEELGDVEAVVEIEAETIASGLRQVVYVLAPERIVFGGGVSKLPAIHDAVSRALIDEMSGYAIIEEHRGGFVVPPGLGDDAGVSGALALAMDVA
ncbi:MAG TPA: ROK family protein [Acidimicrobiia bacterium]|jgi:fructokinase